MKNTYIAPETEIVILSENDILLFSTTAKEDGSLLSLTWDDLKLINIEK